MQEEKKNANEQKAVRGTTKAAILEGDPDCPSLVAFSVYDTKPVHFLSTACTGLNWIEKKKKAFDKEVSANVMMSFLRANINDDYNNSMNGVDVGDQLRGTYRIDKWMHKRKWWWAIWMWGVQVLLVNAYLLYKTSHLITWKTNKIMSHYDFRKQIVLAWLGDKEDDNAELDPEEPLNRKRRRDEASVSTAESSSNKRARRVNNESLHPRTGLLKCRLEYDFHYMVPSGAKRPCCSVCRWANNQKDSETDYRVRTGSIGACNKCGISICISCFRVFHTIADVEQLKSMVKKNSNDG